MKIGDKNQNSGKGRKTVRIQERNSGNTLREEVTETTFQRTRKIQRTPNKSELDNSDSDDIPEVEWRAMDRYIKANNDKCGPTTSTATTGQTLVSFWDLVGAESEDNSRSMLELEAKSSMQSPNATMESE